MTVAIVARKSTRDEAQVSINRQERTGREWADTHHPGEPVVVFADNQTPGDRMDRPGWVAFAAAVRAGSVRTVWAYEQSRLTRAGAATWDDVCALLWAAGIHEIHTHRQGRIAVAEGNRLQGRLLAVIDQEEREVATVRTRDALADLAKQGRPSGATGYGYRRSYGPDGRPVLTPHPGQAKQVEAMVSAVAAGDSLGKVADRLNRAKVPTPRGAPVWRRETVRAIVTAPRIVGDRVHRGQVAGPALWPGIVDREVWEQAQAALGRPSRPAGKRRRYLLSGGLAVCDGCGTALISHRYTLGGSTRPGYACPHPSRPDGGCGHCAVLADRLEDHVLSTVARWLVAPEFTKAIDRHLAADASSVAPLRVELAEVESRLAHLAEQWAAGNLLDLENAAARRPLLDRRSALLAELGNVRVPVQVTGETITAAWRHARKTNDVEGLRAVLSVVLRPVRVRSAFSDGRRLPVAERATVLPVWH